MSPINTSRPREYLRETVARRCSPCRRLSRRRSPAPRLQKRDTISDRRRAIPPRAGKVPGRGLPCVTWSEPTRTLIFSFGPDREAQKPQSFPYDLGQAARCHRDLRIQWEPVQHVDHFRTGTDAGQQFHKAHLLLVGCLLHRQVIAEIAVEALDDLPRGHSAEMIEQRFGEIGGPPQLQCQRFAPGLVMDRHGVGQRPVAIEDEAVVFGRGEGDHGR